MPKGLLKTKVTALVDFLRGKVEDDDLKEIERLLTRNVEGNDSDTSMSSSRYDDLGMPAMDSRGRRLVRPASLTDRQAFEKEHGITPRRIRVL